MIPQLRFPEFTDEWQVKKLGDSFQIGSSKRVFQSEWQDAGIPFYRTREIVALSRGEGFKTPIYISEQLFDEYSKRFGAPKKGDILMTGVGTIGKTFLVDRNFDFYFKDGNVIWLRGNDFHDSRFIYQSYKTRNVIKQIENNASITTVGTYTIDDARKTKVAIPSKPEQEKIADFLTAVDERIGVSERRLEQLQRYKRGVMQQIFSQQVRFKNEYGKDYPDWEERKLGAVFEEVINKVGEKNVETYSITAGKGFVSQAEKFGRDISGKQNERYTLLSEDEFAYNKGNSKSYTYGCVYRNTEGKPIAVPNVFISFRLKDNGMAVGFFEQLFIGHYLDRYLRQLISSGARMDGLLNVNKGDFFDIKLPVASKPEQQKIADFLTAVDDKIKAEETKLASAKKFKKALLQRMFV